MMKVTGKGVFGVKTTPFTDDLKKVYAKPKSNVLYGKSEIKSVYGKVKRMPGL